MLAVVVLVGLPAAPGLAQTASSDPRATDIADRVMESMGGEDAWNNTHYISWNFFDSNTHYWDKWTGNHRIESENRIVLLNVNTLEGRVWENGQEVADSEALAEALTRGHQSWVNDMYWLFMPYKLRDPGVTLRYLGDDALPNGRVCDVLEMTFEDVGYTPNNRYLISVARDTGLVEQWSWFPNSEDPDPRFTLPWASWQQHGDILLSADRGRGFDWKIAVYDELPEAVFTSQDPVRLP